MAKNYLIGVGGTGSRIIEAVVYMCAAGYGPDNLSVFIVDPDDGNGNLSRTKDLITRYTDCKKNFNPTPDTQLFKTNITLPSPLIWNIFTEKDSSLAYYINHKSMIHNKKDLADFVSVLFSKEELDTQLNEGFRGHPSIGSVVMATPPEDSNPWKMLWDDIVDKKPNDVRVFLAGSIFGGTGAAGVPTLGSRDLIKFNEKAALGNLQSKVVLGGVLILPYFTFDTDPKLGEQMFVTPSDFPIATKAALQYYNEKDLGFDEIYFVGDSSGQKTGKFSIGSKTQENLPHYIEIVAGLAAFDFFAQPLVQGVPEKKHFIACREDEKVNWESLPCSRNPELVRQQQVEFKSSIVKMTSFAIAMLTEGQDKLKMAHDRIRDPWYCDHFNFREKDEKDLIKDPRYGDNIAKLERFLEFCWLFLTWICAIDDESNNVELVDRKKITADQVEVGKDINLLPNETLKFHIGALLKEDSRNSNFNDFIKRGLNTVNIQKIPMSAADKFISIFYQATTKFCEQNYNIK